MAKPLTIPTGADFKQWREERGLTRPQFAKLLGVAVRTIYNYEGEVYPVKEIVVRRMIELERTHKPVKTDAA